MKTDQMDAYRMFMEAQKLPFNRAAKRVRPLAPLSQSPEARRPAPVSEKDEDAARKKLVLLQLPMTQGNALNTARHTYHQRYRGAVRKPLDLPETTGPNVRYRVSRSSEGGAVSEAGRAQSSGLPPTSGQDTKPFRRQRSELARSMESLHPPFTAAAKSHGPRGFAKSRGNDEIPSTLHPNIDQSHNTPRRQSRGEIDGNVSPTYLSFAAPKVLSDSVQAKGLFDHNPPQAETVTENGHLPNSGDSVALDNRPQEDKNEISHPDVAENNRLENNLNSGHFESEHEESSETEERSFSRVANSDRLCSSCSESSWMGDGRPTILTLKDMTLAFRRHKEHEISRHGTETDKEWLRKMCEEKYVVDESAYDNFARTSVPTLPSIDAHNSQVTSSNYVRPSVGVSRPPPPPAAESARKPAYQVKTSMPQLELPAKSVLGHQHTPLVFRPKAILRARDNMAGSKVTSVG